MRGRCQVNRDRSKELNRRSKGDERDSGRRRVAEREAQEFRLYGLLFKAITLGSASENTLRQRTALKPCSERTKRLLYIPSLQQYDPMSGYAPLRDLVESDDLLALLVCQIPSRDEIVGRQCNDLRHTNRSVGSEAEAASQ